MLIDFHTHAFPDKLAERAIAKLSSTGDIESLGNGTVSNLLAAMDQSGVDRAVLLNIATNPKQQTNVNDFAIAVNTHEPRLWALGSLNPDSDCIKAEARRIADAGLKGIKLHPDYIRTTIDDPKFDAVFRACIDNNLFVVSHSGWDFISPEFIHCTPERIVRVLNRFPELRFVAVHMGANRLWEDTERLLIGRNLYIDTSLAGVFDLDKKVCARMLTHHDPEKLLFGSDFPWFSMTESYDYINSLDIPDTLKRGIFSENTIKLMGGLK